MEWVRKGHYYLESTCGEYRIAKSYTRGEPLYTLFKQPPLGWSKAQGVMLGHFATASEAKAEVVERAEYFTDLHRIINDDD